MTREIAKKWSERNISVEEKSFHHIFELQRKDKLDEYTTLKHLLVAKDAFFLSLTEGNSESKAPVLVVPDIIWHLS